jgi:hypothetical protein
LKNFYPKGNNLMKKTALAVVLGLLIQVLPISAFATITLPPPPEGVGGAVVAIAVAFFGLGGSDSKAESSLTPATEFSILNSNPQDLSLMDQAAGGSLNTVEILK